MKSALRSAKYIVIFVLALLIVIIPADIHAGQQKAIRVGCVDIENFLVAGEDGSVSGYGADYLKEIAKYTGWKYEYVRGNWSDCLNWLKEGKIDLLLPAEKSPERAEQYLFSKRECSMDYAALIGRKSDDHYYFQDYDAYNGMRIGMVQGNYLNDIFKEYAKKQGFTYKSVYYKNGSYLSKALKESEVDAIVNGSMSYESNQKLLDKIAYMPAYFITSLSNSKLMDSLDSAMEQIFRTDPYFDAGLYEKYYESTKRQSTGLTREEAEYIKGKPEISVLFETDNYPLEWYDEKTGTCRGLYADLIELIKNESGLNLKFIPNTSDKNSWEVVRDGQADVLASACSVCNFDLSFTDTFYDSNYSLAGKKSQTYDLSSSLKVAVPDNLDGIKSLIHQKYPHWILVPCKTGALCLDAVSRGHAELACISALSPNDMLDSSNMVILETNALTVPTCLGISNKSDPLLASVLSKAVLKLEPRQLEGCIINSITTLKSETTLTSFIRGHLALFITAIIIILIIITACVFSFYRGHMQKKQNQLLQQKTLELEEAAEIQEKLRLRAQTDLLTNLKNKDTVEQTCQEYLIAHPEGGYALLILDLDHFKQINDKHGHLSGDGTLRRFAQILSETAGPKDIVGRIGGDEFLMFFSHAASEEDVLPYIEKIYQLLSDPLEHLPEVSISCSIGGIINTGKALSFTELFTMADQCLYEAKRRGRNQYRLSSI